MNYMVHDDVITSSGSISLNSMPRPVQAIHPALESGASSNATRNCHSCNEPLLPVCVVDVVGGDLPSEPHSSRDLSNITQDNIFCQNNRELYDVFIFLFFTFTHIIYLNIICFLVLL